MSQLWANLGTGGTALDARNGSGTGVDSNDALFLDHTGTNYLYLPGVAGNYASTPDAAGLDITGDIELVVRCSADTWTPAAEQYFLAKYSTVGNQRSYVLGCAPSGRLSFRTSVDGTAAIYSQTSVIPTMTAGVTYWLRVTADLDNGAGGNTIRFFMAADQPTEPTSWTQIGTDVVNTGTTSIYSGSAALEIGTITGGVSANYAGRVYRAMVRNGIGGSVVFDADFTVGITTGAQTSFTATTGQTVTINRSTAGRKAVAVTQSVWLLGTDDYFEIADNDLLDFGASDSFTVLAVARKWGNGYTTTAGFYAAKQGDPTTQPGYRLGYDATTDVFAGRGGGATVATGARGTAGEFEIIAGVRNVSADTFTVFKNGVAATAVSDSTTATLANGLALNVGRIDLAASSLYADMELFAVAVIRRALTAGEIAALSSYYASRFP